MAKSKDVITQIRKAARRKFSADEKIRIILEDLRGQWTKRIDRAWKYDYTACDRYVLLIPVYITVKSV